MCERGHDSSTPPAPSPTSTTSNSDERIRGSAVICHLSLPLPLHISKPFPPPASCLTPARRAPWRSMKQQSPLVCLCSIPTTSLLHAPAAPPRAHAEPCFFLSLSLCLLRRHLVVGCPLTRTVSGGRPGCGGLLARTLAWRCLV
jgi:hypothetical protein